VINHKGSGKDSTGSGMEALRDEFNALYADMQSRRSRDAVNQLLCASAETLNRASAKRAKIRG